MNLVYYLNFHSKVLQSLCITFSCIQFKSHVVEFSCKFRKFIAVSFTNTEKNSAGTLHCITCTNESLEKSFFHCCCNSKNFTSRLHFRSKVCIYVHQLFETEYRNFNCKIWRNSVKTCSISHVFKAFTKHSTGCKINHRYAGNL